MITLQNKHKRILKLIIFLQFPGHRLPAEAWWSDQASHRSDGGQPGLVFGGVRLPPGHVSPRPAGTAGFLLALFRKSFTLLWYLSMNLRQRLSKLGWSTTVVLVRSEFKYCRQSIVPSSRRGDIYHAPATEPKGKFSTWKHRSVPGPLTQKRIAACPARGKILKFFFLVEKRQTAFTFSQRHYGTAKITSVRLLVFSVLNNIFGFFTLSLEIPPCPAPCPPSQTSPVGWEKRGLYTGGICGHVKFLSTCFPHLKYDFEIRFFIKKLRSAPKILEEGSKKIFFF